MEPEKNNVETRADLRFGVTRREGFDVHAGGNPRDARGAVAIAHGRGVLFGNSDHPAHNPADFALIDLHTTGLQLKIPTPQRIAGVRGVTSPNGPRVRRRARREATNNRGPCRKSSHGGGDAVILDEPTRDVDAKSQLYTSSWLGSPKRTRQRSTFPRSIRTGSETSGGSGFWVGPGALCGELTPPDDSGENLLSLAISRFPGSN